jgi:hypothetical protein
LNARAHCLDLNNKDRFSLEKRKERKEKGEKASSSEPKRKIQDFYSFPNIELGRGAFSIVHLAKCNETGDEVRFHSLRFPPLE